MLPLIDISPLINGTRTQKQQTGEQLRQACTTHGFFYITGHGVPEAELQSTFATAKSFFDLPLPEKTAITASQQSDFRGYTALLAESYGELPDLHENFDLAAKSPELNRWPATLPSLRPVSETYLTAMTELGRTLMRGFSLALRLPETYFDPLFTTPMATLRFLHYPTQSGIIDERQIGIGAHTDFEALTILAQDSVNALQVSDGAGGWLEAPPIPGSFVVNIGDMLQRWTNDFFRSTLHRVINKSGQRRQSLVFFLGPNEDTMITGIPTCAPDRYAPVRALDYSRARLAEAYGA